MTKRYIQFFTLGSTWTGSAFAAGPRPLIPAKLVPFSGIIDVTDATTNNANWRVQTRAKRIGALAAAQGFAAWQIMGKSKALSPCVRVRPEGQGATAS